MAMAAAPSICYVSLSSTTYCAVARIDGSASASAGAGLSRLESCCERAMLQAATRGEMFDASIGSTVLARRPSFQSNSHRALILLNSTRLGRIAPASGYKLLPISPGRKHAAETNLLPMLASNLSNIKSEGEPCGDDMLTSSRYTPGSEYKLLPPPHRSQLQDDQFEKKLNFWIIRATTSKEGYAAARLRAQCFYSYPAFTPTTTEGLDVVRARLKHDLHIQNLMESRTKSEFERDAKMESADMNVRCLLAVCEASTHEELRMSLRKERTPSPLMAPPALNSPAFTSKRLVALGTLDIQDGTGTKATVDVNAVTFQLYNLANTSKTKRGVSRGKISEPGPGRGRSLLSHFSGQPQSKHGYIFNLSVTENARRCGVATALMREAEQVSKEMHLRTIYVHVEEDNDLALALYQKLGYVIREVEDFDLKARFQRPRRILLSYSFQ